MKSKCSHLVCKISNSQEGGQLCPCPPATNAALNRTAHCWSDRLLSFWKTTQARQLEKSQELVTSTANMSKIHEKECFWKVIVVFYELLHSFLLNHFTLGMYSLYNICVLPQYADLNTFLSVFIFYRIPSPKSKSDLLLLHINTIGAAKNKYHKSHQVWVPKGATI